MDFTRFTHKYNQWYALLIGIFLMLTFILLKLLKLIIANNNKQKNDILDYRLIYPLTK